MKNRYWIVVSRTEDVLLQTWISHCLELDVVSQGTTARHAYAMGVEATELVLKWDMEEQGVRRSPAPAGEFEELYKLIAEGQRVKTLGEALIEVAPFKRVAVRVEFTIREDDGDVHVSSWPPADYAPHGILVYGK